MTRLSWLLVALLLAGCGGLLTKEGGSTTRFSFLNTYEAALRDYDQGRIMTSRARILAMDKTREDYPQALKLLQQKVEPARLRLVKHYHTKAMAAEQAGKWSQAMELYQQAADHSAEPEALKQSRDSMEMKMRQQRMDSLLTQRRVEDSALLAWAEAYEPPKGVSPKDSVFERAREHAQDMIEERASLVYSEARRYMGKKQPEIAYIEAESYLRLEPDSDRGKQLMEEIKNAMPKGIQIAPVQAVKSKTVKLSKRTTLPDSVTLDQVEALIDKGEWIQAKKFALIYRREGGKNAEQLLRQIQSSTEKEAADLFARGSLEFRREHLHAAIRHWEQAAALMPENVEYADALRRARQVQERLQILRSEAAGETAPKQDE
ncbi:MAG: 4-hydroxy-3-methylbut-2-en-1-yl diphosphate synthase [Mariprofundaceae bacterium]|nr:4-hydroxy-3-methylbut-2-en-1-yl diphosphate synthase [Mariprofundaceae bacterium]